MKILFDLPFAPQQPTWYWEIMRLSGGAAGSLLIIILFIAGFVSYFLKHEKTSVYLISFSILLMIFRESLVLYFYDTDPQTLIEYFYSLF